MIAGCRHGGREDGAPLPSSNRVLHGGGHVPDIHLNFVQEQGAYMASRYAPLHALVCAEASFKPKVTTLWYLVGTYFHWTKPQNHSKSIFWFFWRRCFTTCSNFPCLPHVHTFVTIWTVFLSWTDPHKSFENRGVTITYTLVRCPRFMYWITSLHLTQGSLK